MTKKIVGDVDFALLQTNLRVEVTDALTWYHEGNRIGLQVVFTAEIRHQEPGGRRWVKVIPYALAANESGKFSSRGDALRAVAALCDASDAALGHPLPLLELEIDEP